MTIPTILIPACNEAAVIERTLRHMHIGMVRREFNIVVIANACTDDTAALARETAPEAMVIETQRAGKTHALNIGRMAAPPGAPIVFLDADLEVTAESLRALIAPILQGKAVATCGGMEVRAETSSSLVRAFYRGWRLNPYFRNGKFGGLFALSCEGAARVFPLPNVIADDEFIRRTFDASETAFVPECIFIARAPARLTNLLHVRKRSMRGARAIARLGRPTPEKGSGLAMARQVLRRPSQLYAFTIFTAITLWTRCLLALEGDRAATRWERDTSSRSKV